MQITRSTSAPPIHPQGRGMLSGWCRTARPGRAERGDSRSAQWSVSDQLIRNGLPLRSEHSWAVRRQDPLSSPVRSLASTLSPLA